MRPSTKSVIMALTAAHCVLASLPIPQPDHVQEVIDALKVQLDADNVTDVAAAIKDAEASLLTDGILTNGVIADLEKQIQVGKRRAGLQNSTSKPLVFPR
jgi:hypothetical protein